MGTPLAARAEPSPQEPPTSAATEESSSSRRHLPPAYDKGTCINGWCRNTSCGVEEIDGPLVCRAATRVGNKPRKETVCEGIEGPCREYDVELDPMGRKTLRDGRTVTTPRSCKRVCRRYRKRNPWVRGTSG